MALPGWHLFRRVDKNVQWPSIMEGAVQLCRRLSDLQRLKLAASTVARKIKDNATTEQSEHIGTMPCTLSCLIIIQIQL